MQRASRVPKLFGVNFRTPWAIVLEIWTGDLTVQIKGLCGYRRYGSRYVRIEIATFSPPYGNASLRSKETFLSNLLSLSLAWKMIWAQTRLKAIRCPSWNNFKGIMAPACSSVANDIAWRSQHKPLLPERHFVTGVLQLFCNDTVKVFQLLYDTYRCNVFSTFKQSFFFFYWKNCNFIGNKIVWATELLNIFSKRVTQFVGTVLLKKNWTKVCRTFSFPNKK